MPNSIPRNATSRTARVAAGAITVAGLVVAGVAAPASAADPTYTATVIDPSQSFAREVKTADLDGDGLMDLVLPGYSPGGLVVYYGKAGGGYDKVSYPIPAYGEHLAIADADGDGDLDVVIPTREDSAYQVNLLTNNGSRSFTSSVISPADNTAEDIEFADVTGDATPEVVYTNYFGNSVEILKRQADGSYVSAAKLPTAGTGQDGYDLPNGLAVADVTGDGILDIASADRGSDDVTVFVGSATGAYTATTVPLGSSSDDVRAGDVDGDGVRELVVRSQQGDINVLDPAPGGGWAVTAVPTPNSNTADLALTDVDGDGTADIVGLSYQGIAVYQHQADGSYAVTSTSPVTSPTDGRFNPSAFVPADLDGDGDLDFVASNYASGAGEVLALTNTSPVVTPVDSTAPTTTDDVPSTPVTGPRAVTLTATDNAGGSGVARINYAIGTAAAPASDPRDSGALVYDPADRPVLTDGQYIRYSAADRAGNVEEPKISATLTMQGAPVLDTTAPTTTDDVPAAVVTTPVTVTLTATDESGGSGVAGISFTIGTEAAPPADPTAAAGQTYDPTHKPVLTDGQEIRYAASDQAGNTETPHTSMPAKVSATITTPAISGTAQVGKVLQVATPTATPATATIINRWFRHSSDGTNKVIAGATAASYQLVPADAGFQIIALVGASADGYRSAVAVSSPTATVAGLPIAAYTVRAVGGVKVGTVRVAQTSLDGDDSVTLTYQWQRASGGGHFADLPGAAARKRSYELPPAVSVVNVRVLVTAHRAGVPARDTASAQLLILPGDHDASDLHITGVRKAGRKLTAVFTDVDRPDGLVVTYDWTIGGNEIRLKGRTITIPARAAGKKVIVDVRLVAPGYHNQQLRSPAIYVQG